MINKIIATLIASDFLLQAGWGMVGPIFAIFITKQLHGSVAAVGFIAATYWITKSVVQPFLARLLDMKKGERDDFWFYVCGMYAANLIPLGYFFASQPLHIFVLEFARGLAMAAVVPSSSAIFTRHISKDWEAFSWSVDSTAIGFGAGLAGALGGIIASMFGFKAVFVLVSALGLLASTVLLTIRHKIFLKDHFQPFPLKEKM